mmetsp:Transcript_38619/g.69217  ORF Transcript_38619/g.69217 Transcript_38619/m.69217 type:complete len:182 (-) Transcript_38619:90-635(-)
MSSNTDGRLGQTRLSRSATVHQATKFLTQHNQAVAVTRPDQKLRVMVVHDTAWNNVELDLPLAVVDISMEEVLKAVHAAAGPSASLRSPAQSVENQSEPTLATYEDSPSRSFAEDSVDEREVSTRSAPVNGCRKDDFAGELQQARLDSAPPGMFKLEPASNTDSPSRRSSNGSKSSPGQRP